MAMTYRGTSRVGRGLLAAASALMAGVASAMPAPWQLNMTPGVTETAHNAYQMHMIALWICVVIGVLVFGAMFIAIFRDRKSRGAVPATWSHNTKAEIVWTIIPIVILVSMAMPATRMLVAEADTNNAEMTIQVTGYQWKWRYQYLDYQGKPARVNFVSRLDADSDRTRQLDSGLDPHAVKADGEQAYLLNVDKPLVVPTHTKIRFVLTADDVIHAWWVPAFGWKSDAIPGIINDAWVNIEQPGIYRGQCAELCGQDHAFMPIVVIAKPKAEFEQWLAAEQASLDKAAATAQIAAPAPAAAGPQG